MECCFPDLSNIDRSILVQFPRSFFSEPLVTVHVHPYNKIDKTPAWKKLSFILSDRSDFHVIDNLSIAVSDFTWYTFMLL